MTIDTTPSFLDETNPLADSLRAVPVQDGDMVMAWRSPGVFSLATIAGIDYGSGYEVTAVTCIDVLTGETIVNALTSVNTVPVSLLASIVHSYVDSWATQQPTDLYADLLLMARLLEPHARAARLAELEVE